MIIPFAIWAFGLYVCIMNPWDGENRQKWMHCWGNRIKTFGIAIMTVVAWMHGLYIMGGLFTIFLIMGIYNDIVMTPIAKEIFYNEILDEDLN